MGRIATHEIILEAEAEASLKSTTSVYLMLSSPCSELFHQLIGLLTMTTTWTHHCPIGLVSGTTGLFMTNVLNINTVRVFEKT